MCQKNDRARRTVTVLLAVVTALFVFGATLTAAQVATGGTFRLEQSVIAAGGGTSADAGNVFSVTGAIGQPITSASNAAPFTVRSGFFTAAPLAPTAATVSIGGRVKVEGASGKGILNVMVSVTDAGGTTRSTLTGAGGRYRFDDLEAGQTYIFTVAAKRYVFAAPTVVHSATENFDELNFTGTSQF